MAAPTTAAPTSIVEPTSISTPPSSSVVPTTSSPGSTTDPTTTAPPSSVISSTDPTTAPTTTTPGQTTAGPTTAVPTTTPGQTTAAPTTTTPGQTTAGPTTASSSSLSVSDSTTYVIVTVTNADGTVQTSAKAVEHSKGTNVGAIVGGVVGGVGGALLIAVILWWLIRRKRRSYRDDFDDMMFDPAHNAHNRADIDLADQGAPVVDPYSYNSTPGIASTHVEPEMSQTGYGQALSQPSEYGADSSTAPSAGYAGLGAGGAYGAAAGGAYGANYANTAYPTPVPASSSSGGQGHGMSAKQREAFAEQQRFHVQNPTGWAGPSGASGSAAGPSGVTVHEDGGAFPADENAAPEIPPTYDSIRR